MVGYQPPGDLLSHGAPGTYRPRGATSITCRARPSGRSRSQALSWVLTWEEGAALGRGQENGAAGIPPSPGARTAGGPAQVRVEKGSFLGNSQLFQPWHQGGQSPGNARALCGTYQILGSIPEPKGRTQPSGRSWHRSWASQGHTGGTFRPQGAVTGPESPAVMGAGRG